MSLVNDALKKARLEAARGDAANRGIPYPILGSGEKSSSHPWIATLAITIVVATIGGLLLYRAGKQSALEAQGDQAQSPQVANATAVAEVDSTSRPEPADLLLEGTRSTQEAEVQAPPAGSRRPVADSSEREARRERPAPGQRETSPPVVPETEPVAPETHAAPVTPAPARTQPEIEAREPAPTPARESATNTPPQLQLQPIVEVAPDAVVTAQSTEEQEYLRRAEIPGVGPVELGGIAWSGDRPFALINGRVVRPGDTVVGLVVDEIQPNTVRLRGDTGTLVFKLK